MHCKAMNVKKPRTPREKGEKVELPFRQQKVRVAAVLTKKRVRARKRFGYRKDKPLPQAAITMNNMTYAEMKARKDELLTIDTTRNVQSSRYLFKIKQKTANNKEIAAKYLDRMAKICDDPNERADVLVELADIQFDIGDLRKSEKTFREFIELYPGHQKIEYSYYKALLCSYFHTLSPDRDQTATYTAIKLADDFLDRMDLFVEYQDEVKRIKRECYHKLVDSELAVCDYYLARSNFKAVENRLEVVRNQFMPEVPEIESQLISFESNLALKRAEFMAYQEKNRNTLPTIKESPVCDPEPETIAQDETRSQDTEDLITTQKQS